LYIKPADTQSNQYSLQGQHIRVDLYKHVTISLQ